MIDANTLAVYKKLKAVRTRKDLKLKPTPYLKETFTGFDGEEHPLTVRYYQVQMVLHLVAMSRFVVGDDTGLGKCCPYDTLVLTDRGLLQMGEIEDWSGMEPDSFRPLSRTVHVLVDGERLPIKNFYYGGVKPTITATTRYGFRNTGSLVHPMRVLREGRHEWVESRDLVEGDYLCIERRGMAFPDTEPTLFQGPGAVAERMTPDLARFLGYYIGEGALTSKYQVRISQCPVANPEAHTDINRLFEAVFGERLKRPDAPCLYRNDVKSRNWLAANGLDYCKSSDRSIPACIFQATRESSREFLRALFEGEGHVSSSLIEYSTASEELGRQVQVMLLRFGVVANRSINKVKSWRLTVCGGDAQKFRDEIGFLSSRKVGALETLVNRPRNTNHDVVPKIQWLIEQVRADLLDVTSRSGANADRVGSGLKQLGVPLVNTLNNIRNYGRNPSYTFIEKVVGILEEQAPNAASLGLLKSLLETRYFYDPIVSLEGGEDEVFDIEVDDPRHCFVANGLINHNTLETITALCYVWANNPETKAVILTTKSATPQWGGEFEKFTVGVTPFVCQGTPKNRAKVREAYEAHDLGPAVLIMGYRTAVQDFRSIQDWSDYILITDEATAYKNPKTQVHQVVEYMGSVASRLWALTATLIKNNLMEGYGIYRVVQPNAFTIGGKPMSITQFMYYFCIVEMMALRRGPRIPRIVGYHPEKVAEFRKLIDPYYLGRPKHEVADELPSLTLRTIEVGLTKEQEQKYKEALSGLLTVGEASGEEEDKEVTKLTAITYCQQIVNHPALIDCDGDSEKVKALIELLKDGDLAGQKVIIFSRFKKMVNLLMPLFEKQLGKGKAVRITGDENGDQRQAAKARFQNPKGDTCVVCITMAGADAINLQAAKAIIFFDSPWSAGDYLQILGRMIRIGSVHDAVYAIHLVAKGAKPTVDHRVMEVLTKKMHLLEAVLGKRLKGEGLQDNEIIRAGGDVNDLFEALRQDAKGAAGLPVSSKKKKMPVSKPQAPIKPDATPALDDDPFADWD